MKKATALILVLILLFSSLPAASVVANAADTASVFHGDEPAPVGTHAVSELNLKARSVAFAGQNALENPPLYPGSSSYYFVSKLKWTVYSNGNYVDFTGNFAEGEYYFPSYLIRIYNDSVFADSVTVTFDDGTVRTVKPNDNEITVTGPAVKASGAVVIGKTGNCTWTYNSGQHTMVISGNGNLADYESPVDAPWYPFSYQITSLIISGSVKSVGKNSFANSALTSVNISSIATSIGESAFSNCSNLASVKLDPYVTAIEDRAFEGTALTSITLLNNLESIGGWAFSKCKSLTSINFNNKLTTIGTFACYGTALTSVTVPDSVNDIGGSAFSGCKSLASVTLGNNIKTIRSGTL